MMSPFLAMIIPVGNADIPHPSHPIALPGDPWWGSFPSVPPGGGGGTPPVPPPHPQFPIAGPPGMWGPGVGPPGAGFPPWAMNPIVPPPPTVGGGPIVPPPVPRPPGGLAGQLPASDPSGSGWVWAFVPGYGWMWAQVPQPPATPPVEPPPGEAPPEPTP